MPYILTPYQVYHCFLRKLVLVEKLMRLIYQTWNEFNIQSSKNYYPFHIQIFTTLRMKLLPNTFYYKFAQ